MLWPLRLPCAVIRRPAIVAWRSLVGNPAPANRQAVLDLHADTHGGDLTLADPRRSVDIFRFLNHEIVLIREFAAIVEVANVVLPGIAFPWPSSCDTRAAVGVAVNPSCVQSSRCKSPGVKDEADIR